MNNEYRTFYTTLDNEVLTVTFDYKPVNVIGLEMMSDLNNLFDKLEKNSNVKVIIFNSAIKGFFIAHADIDYLQYLSTKKVPFKDIQVNDLAKTLDRLTKLPQVTIAQIEGYARGGGHEFALACDLRYATKDSIFMQMEVGMGILPCGGGSVRLARQCGLGNALKIILSAEDYNAEEALRIGSINDVIDSEKINLHVLELANRISKFPSESINACKQTVYASTNLPIEEALKVETYQLYQATSMTPAVKRFKYAAETNFQNNLYNQKNFQTLLMNLQNIK